MQDNNIKVSVICNAFNHEKYIEDALQGFVSQNTSFSFEILIHDDASTDKTASIIKKYEELYPELIKPIYQKENQYSQGVNITNTFQLPRAKGKYVALCEGDDYWINRDKLQMQYDEMEKNPDIDICAHAAKKLHAGKRTFVGKIRPSKEKAIFTTDDVIKGGGGFVATSSLFVRKSIYNKTPEFRKYYAIDYSLQILGSLKAGMLYLPNCMSIYRLYVPNSWTTKTIKEPQFYIAQMKHTEEMLKILDRETDGKYFQAIDSATKNLQLAALLNERKFDEMHKGEMKIVYQQKPLLWKIKVKLKEFFPQLLNLYRN